MNSLPVTSMVAAVLACLMFVLTALVSMRRVELGKQSGDIAKFVFGHGEDEKLRRRIRAFGNFIEYTPIALILFALTEYQGAAYSLMLWLGGAFVIGRLLHALGMLLSPRFPLPRVIGMFATYAALLVPAGWMLTNLA